MNKLRTLLFSFTLLLAIFLFSGPAHAKSYVNPNQTYSFVDMKNDMKELQAAYPGLVKTKVIGKSEYGRNIYAISVGKGDSTIFLNGAHHAREWITTNLNMNMADKYAAAYKSNSKIGGYSVRKLLNHTTIWFVPMVNPDGVILQQTGLKHFPKKDHAKIIKMNGGSKNFKRWKANGKGVDLNRQYNLNWSQLSGPKSPSFKNYKGSKAATAAEAKAIISFVETINPEMAVAYHTSGQIIFWKYLQTGSRYTQDAKYASKIGKMTGYSLVKNRSTGGGFSDWFSGSKKKPAITIEVSPFVGETNVPVRNFSKIWSQNQSIGLYVAQEGYKLYHARQTAAAEKRTAQLKTFNKTAAKLKNYYSTNITSQNKLTISSAHKKLYDQTVKEIKTQEKAIAKLPSQYRSKPNAALKTAKTYRDRSLAFMNGVKAGDSLVQTKDQLTGYMKAGTLNSTTLKTADTLTKNIKATESKIKNMYSQSVKNLATAKYTTPAKSVQKTAGYDLKRYQHLLDTGKLLDQELYEETRKALEKYDTLPSTHSYSKTEARLSNMREAIEKELEQAEAVPEIEDSEEEDHPV